MRLIDADNLTPVVIKGERQPVILIRDAIKAYVEVQPTAYDVDKVVTEIEKFADCEDCRRRGIDKKFYYGQGCKACAFGKIIDIVKRGGIE